VAQKVTVVLIDDLNGETIEQGSGGTVRFAFDGNSYEIDLTEANLDAIRGRFAYYITAARKVSGRSGRSPISPSIRTDPTELASIRKWAAENGYEVSGRGRISRTVREAYTAAH